MMTMAPGMEVASTSNPTTSDPLSPHSNARSPVNSSSTAAWYPPAPSASSAITDPRYSSTSHVDNMMMPGASSLHRGASSPPVGSGGVLPIDTQQHHTTAAMAVDNPAAFFSAASSAAEASRYYQMHQAYENAATQGKTKVLFSKSQQSVFQCCSCLIKHITYFNYLIFNDLVIPLGQKHTHTTYLHRLFEKNCYVLDRMPTAHNFKFH